MLFWRLHCIFRVDGVDTKPSGRIAMRWAAVEDRTSRYLLSRFFSCIATHVFCVLRRGYLVSRPSLFNFFFNCLTLALSRWSSTSHFSYDVGYKCFFFIRCDAGRRQSKKRRREKCMVNLTLASLFNCFFFGAKPAPSLSLSFSLFIFLSTMTMSATTTTIVVDPRHHPTYSIASTTSTSTTISSSKKEKKTPQERRRRETTRERRALHYFAGKRTAPTATCVYRPIPCPLDRVHV